jgi:hypothetical protein
MYQSRLAIVTANGLEFAAALERAAAGGLAQKPTDWLRNSGVLDRSRQRSAFAGSRVNWQEGNANRALANFLILLRRRYPSSF